MKRLGRPGAWLSLSLLLLAAGGTICLTRDPCVSLSQRDRSAYGQRPWWQAGFDALSAACGVGLLTYDLREDYTPLGRWVLAAIGVAGAMLYLAAARQAVGPLWAGSAGGWPSISVVLAAFVVWQLGLALLLAVARWLSGAAPDLAATTWQVAATFASLGWLNEPPTSGWGRIYALITFLGALGWPWWLLAWRRGLRLAGLLTSTGTYVAFLLLCVILITALEVPRGTGGRPPAADERLASQPVPARFLRSLIQVTSASGAGLPTEVLHDRRVCEGTKLVLAGVVLVGGLGGSAGGGLKWSVLLWVLAGLVGTASRSVNDQSRIVSNQGETKDAHASAAPCPPPRPRSPLAVGYCPLVLAATACAVALALVTLVITLGLLLIESRVGSPYQSPPTLADALLEAAAAVGGAGLSSGLTATLTSVGLSSGIRQDVDLYQYGMSWLMLGMLIGRLMPVVVVAHYARRMASRVPAWLGPNGPGLMPPLV